MTSSAERTTAAYQANMSSLKFQTQAKEWSRKSCSHIRFSSQPRSAGKGTGLGLAIVYGIVKNHQGYITCQSRIGLGTTFRIYFPTIKSTEIFEEKPRELQTKGAQKPFSLWMMKSRFSRLARGCSTNSDIIFCRLLTETKRSRFTKAKWKST